MLWSHFLCCFSISFFSVCSFFASLLACLSLSLSVFYCSFFSDDGIWRFVIFCSSLIYCFSCVFCYPSFLLYICLSLHSPITAYSGEQHFLVSPHLDSSKQLLGWLVSVSSIVTHSKLRQFSCSSSNFVFCSLLCSPFAAITFCCVILGRFFLVFLIETFVV